MAMVSKRLQLLPDSRAIDLTDQPVTFMNAAAERLTGFKFDDISKSECRSLH